MVNGGWVGGGCGGEGYRVFGLFGRFYCGFFIDYRRFLIFRMGKGYLFCRVD